MAPSPWPWMRYFQRTPQEDIDTVPDAAFIQANFTDFFGSIWLPQNSNAMTFDGVLRPFWNTSQGASAKNSFSMFCVADGGRWQATTANSAWFNQHIRFVVLVAGGPNGSESPFQDSTPQSWTLCIVGSQQLTATDRFLQVASWDGKVFRYYGRDELQAQGVPDGTLGWIYQGTSADAFLPDSTDSASSYLGPFNGHVNGSLLMKELRKPWIHWFGTSPDPVPNFPQSILDSFSHDLAPYLTGESPCSLLQSAEVMMGYITEGIGKWMNTRATNNFRDSNKQQYLDFIPNGLKRWVAHILLTTTINIASAALQDPNKHNDMDVPPGHFYNQELATFNIGGKNSIFPNFFPSFYFSPSVGAPYQTAANKNLQLVILQDVNPVPPGMTPVVLPANTSLAAPDPKTGLVNITCVVVDSSEGPDGQFTIVQPSFEDAQGARVLMTQMSPVNGSKPAFLSYQTFNAMMMVDPWNPIYSWRRGVLLQYVPDSATFDSTTGTYDLDATFVKNVTASPMCKDSTSPESLFLANLKSDQTKFPNIFTTYLNAVQSRLGTVDGMTDYLRLAESRRRIYRSLPLDEFALTLPWALNYGTEQYWEMKSDGTVVPMDARGVNFFNTWRTSVSGYNPQIIPTPDADTWNSTRSSSSAEIISTQSHQPLPAIACQPSTSAGRLRKSGCPISKRRHAKVMSTAPLRTPQTPTWNDDIRVLFSAPPWLPKGQQQQVGQNWIDQMKYWGPLDLCSYEAVKAQAEIIYQHCASQSMPITSDPTQYWPADVLETFATWIDQGCRQSTDDPITRLKSPVTRLAAPAYVTRKDVRNLTADEIQIFRVALDDILGVGSLQGKWQELGQLHAWWCLHYQEGTFPWHRCWLRYVESLIGSPIPYWNVFASDAGDPTSQFAGLPQIFLDETYIHPDGSTRPNPLKYALAYQGLSKDKTSKYVQRNPKLVNGRPSQPGPALDAWNEEINLFATYRTMFQQALLQDLFSQPEGIGMPWANFPTFSESMDPTVYHAQHSFDGYFEQPHDNGHGWVGGSTGDMSDNTYTGFDPIFMVYHCGLDRLFDIYLNTHPNITVTAQFPLKPFGSQALSVNYTNPSPALNATIGEMTRSSQSIGYIYGPPACPDNFGTSDRRQAAKSTGGFSIRLLNKQSLPLLTKTATQKPIIIFKDVACTDQSYEIDVFLNGAKSTVADPVSNPDFVGRLFRLGMGIPHDDNEPLNKGRCRSANVTRVLQVENFADKIKDGFFQVVKRLESSGAVEVPKEEWKNMRGFVGELAWVV